MISLPASFLPPALVTVFPRRATRAGRGARHARALFSFAGGGLDSAPLLTRGQVACEPPQTAPVGATTRGQRLPCLRSACWSMLTSSLLELPRWLRAIGGFSGSAFWWCDGAGVAFRMAVHPHISNRAEMPSKPLMCEPITPPERGGFADVIALGDMPFLPLMSPALDLFTSTPGAVYPPLPATDGA